MTHRRPQDVVPSSIHLGLVYASIYFDGNKQDAVIDRPSMVIERRLYVTDVQLNRIVKFRRSHPHIPVFDVLDDDLWLCLRGFTSIRKENKDATPIH